MLSATQDYDNTCSAERQVLNADIVENPPKNVLAGPESHFGGALDGYAVVE